MQHILKHHFIKKLNMNKHGCNQGPYDSDEVTVKKTNLRSLQNHNILFFNLSGFQLPNLSLLKWKKRFWHLATINRKEILEKVIFRQQVTQPQNVIQQNENVTLKESVTPNDAKNKFHVTLNLLNFAAANLSVFCDAVRQNVTHLFDSRKLLEKNDNKILLKILVRKEKMKVDNLTIRFLNLIVS